MGAFLVACVVIAILFAGSITLSVHLNNTSIKGQQLSGSQRFYAVPRRSEMVYASRKFFVIVSVVLVVLGLMAIEAVMSAIVR
jgi:hypothetical protein